MDRRALDELYEGVGLLAYDPLILLKMVLYQYLKWRRSPETWFEARNCYQCPAGHELSYSGRERKKRHGGQSLRESRYRCAAVHCGNCPLAAQYLRPGSSSRTIKRLEGQELLDAQHAKMSDPEIQPRYALRGQTVELGFADAKSHRGLQRFHGRGLDRARTETGLLVLAQNLLRLDRLKRDAANAMKTAT